MTLPTDAEYAAHGCGDLIATVIQQAFHDVFAPATSYGNKELLRSEAISFLTSKTGEWAAHRRFLCDLIGIDSDVLRRHVHEVLMGERDPIFAKQGIERTYVEQFKPQQADTARKVYQRQNNHPQPGKPKPRETKSVETKPTGIQPIPAYELKPSAVMDEWLANLTADA